MIDLHVLRSNPDVVAEQLAKKDPQFPLADLIACDKNARQLQMKVEELRSEKKRLSKGGEASPEVRERSRTLGIALKSVEHDLEQAQEAVRKLWLRCPNLALEAVPVGTKQQNQVVRSWGTDPEFTFSVQNHLELNKTNKWFDMDAGARMSGAQFVFYTPLGTKIVYALTQMMLRNNVAHGFQPVMPPSLVTEKALYNSGNLPKFAGDFYQIPEDDVCLIPTSEVCLTNLHAPTNH